MRNTHTPKSYKTYEIVENATIVPSTMPNFDYINTTVYDSHKNIIDLSLQHRPGIYNYPQKFTKASHFFEKEVIICDLWIDHFGHFIFETLSKIWLAKQYPDFPLVFSILTSRKNANILNWQKEILDVLDIKNEIIFVTEPTCFKKAYIPFPLAIFRTYFTQDYFTSYQVYEAQTIPNKKIFLSRSNFQTNGYSNQLEIEEYAKALGYKILIPEEMDLKQLLFECASAEHILTIEGSALYNLCFIKNLKAQVDIIPRMYNTDYFLLFANMANVNILDIKYKIIKKARESQLNLIHANINEIDLALKERIYIPIDKYKFDEKIVNDFVENQKIINQLKFSFLDDIQEIYTLKAASIANEKEEIQVLLTRAINSYIDYIAEGLAYNSKHTHALIPLYYISNIFSFILAKEDYKAQKETILKLKKMYWLYRFWGKILFTKKAAPYNAVKRSIKSILLYIE